jgi:hypothetical protein
MLMHVDHSVLLLIDFQVRLQPAIDATQVLEAGVWLTRLAQRLQVPVICTEQYPKGLGPTMPALRALLPDACIDRKDCISRRFAEIGLVQGAGWRPRTVRRRRHRSACLRSADGTRSARRRPTRFRR